MRLRPASDAEKIRRDRLTHAAWGQRLDPSAYGAREAGLRAHPWAKEVMTTWLWTGASGEILASCETFRMESRLGEQRGVAFGVASVFVEPALRGTGHCTAMMRALVERLRTEPGAQAAILFSDVGAPIYERAGFSARPAFETILPAAADAESAPGLVHLDEAGARDAAAERADPGGTFAVMPTAAQVDWHLERERLYARLLGLSRPRAWGARLGRGVAVWSGDLKNGRLDVLLLDAGEGERSALLAEARRTAADAGLRDVVLWEGETGRAGSLPMIAPLAVGLMPEDWTWIPRALWI